MNLKIVAIGVIGALLITGVVLCSPADVESRQYVLTPTGYTEEPVTIHSMTWAKLLWDAGYDLYYTADTGFVMPGSF